MNRSAIPRERFSYLSEKVIRMGKFVVIETKAGFHFNLKAANGEIIGTSETYKTKAACENGIASVQKNCVGDVEDQTLKTPDPKKCPKFEIFKTKDDQFRFRLVASNGEKILASESYKAKDSCKNGIASVKKNAPEAPVVYED